MTKTPLSPEERAAIKAAKKEYKENKAQFWQDAMDKAIYGGTKYEVGVGVEKK